MLILNYQQGKGGEKMIISDFLNMLLSGGLTTFVIVIILAILIVSYKKASPNEVLIITGGCLGKKGPYLIEDPETHTRVKVVKGGGAFVIPFIQQAEFQTLDTFNVDVSVEDIMTIDAVPVDASANALLRVGSTPELIAKAAEKTLGLSEEERQSQMIEVVRGGVREVLSGLTPKQANDRAEFQNQVRQSIEETFANLGLEITALQITKISDKNGYYDSLSAKEIADKRSYARQAKAEAEKEAQLVEVKNNQEAQEAQLQSKRYISDKTKETDVAIAQNDAQVQTEKAKAEQAYAIEKAVQEQTLKEKEIIVRENELKSTVIAQQNAEAQAVQIKAEADANALRIKAQADKDAQNLSTDANAYSIREQGQASADKIQVEGQANAKAQEAIAKALEQNGQVALAMAIIDKLPEISASYAQAVASIDQLTVFDGAAGVSGQTNEGLAQSLAFIKDATGIDVAELVNKRADGTTTLNRPVPVEENK